MNNSSAPASLFSWIFRLVLLGLGIYAIYWIYKKLYGGAESASILMKDIHVANSTTFSYPTVNPVFEGGEYSLSAWIYVNDYASDTRKRMNKDILKFGNFASDDGILVVGLYLDAYDNTLHVITSSTPTVAAGGGAAGPASIPQGKMTKKMYNDMFTGIISAGPQTALNDCKVSPIGYQRWVHVAVVLDGKTVDVYLDGKLARSCILPSVFMATKDATVKAADNGGFGGYLSGIVANNYAMNPEQVYRQYMAGPLGSVGMWEYIKSFFDPQAIGTLDYPKMN